MSDLRGFWFLVHAERPGIRPLEPALVDLRDVGVEIGVADVGEVVSPGLGGRTLLVGLSSAFSAEVMLFELSDVLSVLWSCACRLGDGSKGAARLDSVEVLAPLVVGL
jgi:hypothetical protein